MAPAPVRFVAWLMGLAMTLFLAACSTFPDQLEQQINQYKLLPGPNKAFAVGFFSNGKWVAGWSYATPTLERAKEIALQTCEEKGAITGQYLACRVMFENDTFIKAQAPVNSTIAAVAPPAPAPAPAPTYAGSGSGVFISSDGLVLTSQHVIKGASVIEVQTRDGRVASAKILATSQGMDLAILSTNLNVSASFPVRLVRPNPGERVFTVGYPVRGLLGQEPKVSDGIVNSATGLFNEAGLMQISIPIQPGNSGGPVITEDGQLIGVVTSSAAVGTFLNASGGVLPQNVNWAMHSSLAVTLLGKDAPAGPKLPREKAIEQAIQASVLVLVRN